MNQFGEKILKFPRKSVDLYVFSVVFICLINFAIATVYYPKTPHSSGEGGSGEGRWESEVDNNVDSIKPQTKLSEGASRFGIKKVFSVVAYEFCILFIIAFCLI